MRSSGLARSRPRCTLARARRALGAGDERGIGRAARRTSSASSRRRRSSRRATSSAWARARSGPCGSSSPGRRRPDRGRGDLDWLRHRLARRRRGRATGSRCCRSSSAPRPGSPGPRRRALRAERVRRFAPQLAGGARRVAARSSARAVERYGPDGELLDRQPDVPQLPIRSGRSGTSRTRRPSTSPRPSPRPTRSCSPRPPTRSGQATPTRDRARRDVRHAVPGRRRRRSARRRSCASSTRSGAARGLRRGRGPPVRARRSRSSTQVGADARRDRSAPATTPALDHRDGWARTRAATRSSAAPEGQAQSAHRVFKYFLEKREEYNIQGVDLVQLDGHRRPRSASGARARAVRGQWARRSRPGRRSSRSPAAAALTTRRR